MFPPGLCLFAISAMKQPCSDLSKPLSKPPLNREILLQCSTVHSRRIRNDPFRGIGQIN